jgi:hypothetical protein
MTEFLNASRSRILVIDDNAAIHRDVGRVLEPRQPPTSFADAKAAFLGGPGGGPACGPLA